MGTIIELCKTFNVAEDSVNICVSGGHQSPVGSVVRRNREVKQVNYNERIIDWKEESSKKNTCTYG
jgi:hypothetical protein